MLPQMQLYLPEETPGDTKYLPYLSHTNRLHDTDFISKAELSLCVSLGFGPRGTSFLFGNSQIFHQKQ